MVLKGSDQTRPICKYFNVSFAPELLVCQPVFYTIYCVLSKKSLEAGTRSLFFTDDLIVEERF